MTDCILWQGAKGPEGYGRYSETLAHRYVWEQANGPIPAGVSILHRCDVRLCVNLEHLYAGTHTDNMTDMRERLRQANQNTQKQFCARGHEFSESNTYRWTSTTRYGRTVTHRRCRTCSNRASVEYHRRVRAGS